MLKKIIFVGLLFFLHVPMGAMEESEELDRAFLEAMQRNAAHASTAGMKEVDEAKLYEGTIDLAAYLQGAAKGVVKGVVELSEVVKHPIDNFFIPVGMFVNDARIIGACGDLGLNYDPEDCVYNYDKERELMGISNYDDAKLRMEERALVLVKSIEHFVAAPGPEKLEILTSMAVTSMVPGTVARGVTKVAVNKYKFGVYANPNKFNNLHPDDLNPRPSISYEEFRNLAGKTEHKWAITTDGKLHLSHPHQEGSLLEIKHPDIVNGKPVIAAGMVHAYFGKLGGKSKNGDFFSGHFRTYGDELKQIVPYIFKKHGFDDFKLKPEPFPAVKEALTHAIPGESILKIEPTPLLAILAASRKTTEPQLELQAQAENPPMQQLNPNLPSQSIINNNNVPNSQGAEAPAITPQSGEARALALLARAKAIQQEREQTRVQAENKARLEIEERMRDLDRVRNQAADRFWDSDEYIRPINAAEEAVKKALDHAALLGKQRMKTVEEFDDLAFACEEAQRAALEVAETYARLLDSDLIVGSDFAKIVAYARENVIAFGKMQGKSQEVAKWQKHVQDFQLKEVGVKKLIAQGEQKKAQASACAANLEKKAREADAGAQRLIKAKANVQLAIEAFVRSAGGIVSASQAAQANQNHTQLQSQLTAAIQELADAGAFDEAVQEQRDAYARAEAARQAAVQEIARQAQVEVLRKELVAASLDNLRIVNWYNTKKKQKAKDLAVVDANKARWFALHAAWVATPEGALDNMGPWGVAAGVYAQEEASRINGQTPECCGEVHRRRHGVACFGTVQRHGRERTLAAERQIRRA